MRGAPAGIANPRTRSPRASRSSPRIAACRGWCSTTPSRQPAAAAAGRARQRPAGRRPARRRPRGPLIERLQIKLASPKRPVRLLSGGNQQKVVIAKWLGRDPDVLIMDEPTAGVDIGTKTEIVQRIRELADSGKAVIVISSELAELLAVSDRVLVLRDGTVTASSTAGRSPTRSPCTTPSKECARDPDDPRPAPGRRAGRGAAAQHRLAPVRHLHRLRARLRLLRVTLARSGFLTSTNLLNIVRQTAIISMMAVAMTFVIAAGQIDLSVGAIAGLASVTTATGDPPLGHALCGSRWRAWRPGWWSGSPTAALVARSSASRRSSSRWGCSGSPRAGRDVDHRHGPVRSSTTRSTRSSAPATSARCRRCSLDDRRVAIGTSSCARPPYGRQVLATGGNARRRALQRRQHASASRSSC